MNELHPNQSKRKRLLAWGLFFVLLAAFLYCPSIRWPLVGLIRNERHYRSLPVSYWRHKIIADAEAREREGGLFGHAGALFNRVTGNAGPDPPIPEGDPGAIPMLLELLDDKDPRVRAGATYALSFRPPDDKVMTALLKVMNDQDAKVRKEAVDSMGRLGSDAKLAVPLLMRAVLNDPDEEVRESAAIAVCALDPETAKKNERVLRQTLGIPNDLPGIHYPFPPP